VKGCCSITLPENMPLEPSVLVEFRCIGSMRDTEVSSLTAPVPTRMKRRCKGTTRHWKKKGYSLSRVPTVQFSHHQKRVVFLFGGQSPFVGFFRVSFLLLTESSCPRPSWPSQPHDPPSDGRRSLPSPPRSAQESSPPSGSCGASSPEESPRSCGAPQGLWLW